MGSCDLGVVKKNSQNVKEIRKNSSVVLEKINKEIDSWKFGKLRENTKDLLRQVSKNTSEDIEISKKEKSPRSILVDKFRKYSNLVKRLQPNSEKYSEILQRQNPLFQLWNSAALTRHWIIYIYTLKLFLCHLLNNVMSHSQKTVFFLYCSGIFCS